MENKFLYHDEIERLFQRRRGAPRLVSTLDYALICTWKDAGIPLEAVLRGIDAAFDKYEKRKSNPEKINSLAYCAQAVLAAAEDMKEAAVGAADSEASSKSKVSQGFEPAVVAEFLRRNAQLIESAKLPQGSKSVWAVAIDAAKTLRQLAEEIAKKPPTRLEDLERHLTVLEEKIFAALLASTPDEEIIKVRAEADHDLAPYRRKMSAPQIEQLQKQYVHKRLLEKYNLPRLSLFYM